MPPVAFMSEGRPPVRGEGSDERCSRWASRTRLAARRRPSRMPTHMPHISQGRVYLWLSQGHVRHLKPLPASPPPHRRRGCGGPPSQCRWSAAGRWCPRPTVGQAEGAQRQAGGQCKASRLHPASAASTLGRGWLCSQCSYAPLHAARARRSNFTAYACARSTLLHCARRRQPARGRGAGARCRPRWLTVMMAPAAAVRCVGGAAAKCRQAHASDQRQWDDSFVPARVAMRLGGDG